MTTISLRFRTLSIVGLTLLALFAVLYPLSSRILLEDYRRLEEKHMQNNLSQARAALNQQLAELTATLQDYAWWDDTYQFMAQRDPTYLVSNLSAAALANLHVDLVAFLDERGEAIFAATLEHEIDQLVALSASALERLRLQRLRSLSKPEDSIAGLILLEEKPLLLAATTVLTSSRNGPSRGVMIMGQYLDEWLVRKLSPLMQLSLSLLPASEVVAYGLSEQTPEVVHIGDGQRLDGYALLQDLNDEPIVVLRVSEERWIYRQGQASRAYMLGSLIVMALICTAVMLWLLEYLILGRLARFDRVMSILSRDRNATLRLPVEGKDELDRLAVTINDMLDSLKETHQQLLHDALHDRLTGLANRALYLDRLQNTIHQAVRHPREGFAVLLLDLDGFKYINDSLGHSAGDQVLITAARRMEYCVRGSDTVARLGGDEFAILVTSMHDSSDAFRLAERLLQELRLPMEWSGHTLQTSTSIGVALYAVSYKTAKQMLRDADIAMYRAKRNGKNCYELFDHAMHLQAQSRLELENDLQLAIQRKELRVYYHPIVSLPGGEITSLEALVRWQHPRRGLLAPEQFISLAGEIGIVSAIDRWVLTEACRCLKQWRERFKPSLSVSINLSSKQLQTINFVKQVRDILASHRLNGKNLYLEITESVLGPDRDQSHHVLNELAKAGVQILLDNFGTGYSSLHRLHQLPVHLLKIDRFFVAKLLKADAKIVSTIIALAHNLGKQVIAEGIETFEQAQRLAELGCEYGQGYYFSKPLPEEEIDVLMADQPPWKQHQPRTLQ